MPSRRTAGARAAGQCVRQELNKTFSRKITSSRIPHRQIPIIAVRARLTEVQPSNLAVRFRMQHLPNQLKMRPQCNQSNLSVVCVRAQLISSHRNKTVHRFIKTAALPVVVIAAVLTKLQVVGLPAEVLGPECQAEVVWVAQDDNYKS